MTVSLVVSPSHSPFFERESPTEDVKNCVSQLHPNSPLERFLVRSNASPILHQHEVSSDRLVGVEEVEAGCILGESDQEFEEPGEQSHSSGKSVREMLACPVCGAEFFGETMQQVWACLNQHLDTCVASPAPSSSSPVESSQTPPLPPSPGKSGDATSSLPSLGSLNPLTTARGRTAHRSFLPGCRFG